MENLDELNSDTGVILNYVNYIAEEEKLVEVLDKEQFFKLKEFVPEIREKFVGKYVFLGELVNALKNGIQSYSSRHSRTCHGTEEFAEDEIFFIGNIGPSTERVAWNNYFDQLRQLGKEPERMVYDDSLKPMGYLRRGEETNKLYFGVFGLRLGEEGKTIENKVDVAEIGFTAKED